MKNELKKDEIVQKAMDALAKQALRDQELQHLKGGGGILGGGGQTDGMAQL